MGGECLPWGPLSGAPLALAMAVMDEALTRQAGRLSAGLPWPLSLLVCGGRLRGAGDTSCMAAADVGESMSHEWWLKRVGSLFDTSAVAHVHMSRPSLSCPSPNEGALSR